MSRSDPWHRQPDTVFAQVRAADGHLLAELCSPRGPWALEAMRRHALRRWGHGAHLSAMAVTDGAGRPAVAKRELALRTRRNPPRAKVFTVRTEDPEDAVFGLTATNDAAAQLLAQLESQLRPIQERANLDEDAVRWALARHAGRIAPAAKLLQVPRTTLRDAMRRLGIPSIIGSPSYAEKRAARGMAMDLLETNRPK